MAISKRLDSASKKLAKASKTARNAEQAYAAGKKVGNRQQNKKNQFITANSAAGRKVGGQFRKVNTTGGKVKGNKLGKTAAVAGLVRGAVGAKISNSKAYKMTSARKSAAANAVGKAKKTFKKEFKAQAMSDKKANFTFGSRKSAAGAVASKLRQRSFAGKVGAKAGVAYKMTSARKAALMKAVRASAAKRRGKKGLM